MHSPAPRALAPALLLSLAALASAPARAAESLLPLGTEVGRPDTPLTVMGFIQPQFDGMLGAPVTGIGDALPPFEGERASFNTVGPTDSTASFRIFRARLGARGSMPGTDQKVSYFLLFEAGEVAITRTAPVVPTDASLTFSHIPGARVRVGQFKLPIMEEFVGPVAADYRFIHFSTTLSRLLLENPIARDTATTGHYTGGAHGFRDVGIQVFDGIQTGAFGASWAAMVSNGNGIMTGDNDDQKDISGRFELAWVTKGARHQLSREEVKVGGWHLQGSRAWGERRFDRMRQGAFVRVERPWAWGLGEVARGRGMLETGVAPPFAGGVPTVAPEGEAWGMVVQGGGRIPVGAPQSGKGKGAPFQPRLGLSARYDRYLQQTESPEDLRIFQTTTLGVELDPAKALRLQANYELRHLDAPDGSEVAQAIAASMGDRVTVQATARF